MRRIKADFKYDTKADRWFRRRFPKPLEAAACARISPISFPDRRPARHRPAGRLYSRAISARSPAGKERLEGADAMHAWVLLWWAGRGLGRLDPANPMMIGNDNRSRERPRLRGYFSCRWNYPRLARAGCRRTSRCRAESMNRTLQVFRDVIIILNKNKLFNNRGRHVQQRDQRRCNRDDPFVPCREPRGERDYRSDQLVAAMARQRPG